MFAPIILFAYARTDHLRRTVEALLKNTSAERHELIIYSDGPRTSNDVVAVENVRKYLQTITGFRSINVHHRPYNFGLAKSIIDGVTEVLQQHEKIIVLEDDMLTSVHFLTYMNEALDRFAADERVISIHGYTYPVEHVLPEAFFLRGADCWGWATWRRGWALFNPNGKYLLNELRRRNLLTAFDFNRTYGFSKMLEEQVKRKNDSWAIRWYASAFLANKLTLYPGRSLVTNIGNDNSGTHFSDTSGFDAALSVTPIDLNGISVEHSDLGYACFETFFESNRARILLRARDFFARVYRKTFK
jgi:hypothetical protein